MKIQNHKIGKWVKFVKEGTYLSSVFLCWSALLAFSPCMPDYPLDEELSPLSASIMFKNLVLFNIYICQSR